jgi:broad specificity phosphatase PhoE
MARTPAPALVHLVRHGLVDNPRRLVYGRQPGWHLGDQGRRQAGAAAARLRQRAIAAVYASPLERAQETAAIIAAAVDRPVITREDLTESSFAVPWEGRPWRDVKARHADEWHTYLDRPLEMRGVAEPLAALAERMGRAIRSLASAHPGQEVVAVSHGDPIKAGALAVTGADLAGLHSLHVPTGAIVTLRVGPGSALIASRWTGDR